jgi:hypothetical protein
MKYDLSNKTTIFKNLVVYRNLLPEVNEIFNFLKYTESYKEKTVVMEPWSDWSANWPGSAVQINSSTEDPLLDLDNEDAKKQKWMINNFFDAYFFALNDYMDEYKDITKWQYELPHFDFSVNHVWNYSGMTILKYDSPGSSNFNYDSLAMNYHTDFNHDNAESRAAKQIITITFYLNDDYEGGEISFYDEDSNTIHNYKPRAGDVTVFPSARPFYHGVLPFSGNPRYLSRMFLMHSYPGSEDWLANEKKYGKEKWEAIEKERLQKSWETGGTLLEIVTDGNKKTHFKSATVTEPPVWIK